MGLRSFRVSKSDLYGCDEEIDTVFYTDPTITAEEVKKSLVEHDGYDWDIIVEEEA